MKEKDYEAEEGFYQACAEILGCDHSYRPFPPKKRNRWSNREAGNGRFPGHGCVRMFSENSVHVMLSNPKINKHFPSREAALVAIIAAKRPT